MFCFIFINVKLSDAIAYPVNFMLFSSNTVDIMA